MRSVRVTEVRPIDKGVLVHFAGVDDCDAATSLRGAAVLVERAAVAVEPDEYLLADLVGFTVLGPDDGTVGEVKAVIVYPSVDAVQVRAVDGRTLELPLLDAWVGAVDVAARSIRLTSLDGLVD